MSHPRDGIHRALLRAEPDGERFLLFERPLASAVATVPGEVPELLEAAERSAAAGRWAVGFVGYEAAPAFDAALAAHPPAAGPAPLAAFAEFGAPREIGRGGLDRSSARIVARGPAIDEPAHAAAVARIRAAIAAGDSYQVNFVFALEGQHAGTPEALVAALLAAGEAPYAALLEGDRWAVLSLSPELFFERAGERVVMRPMKGTRPRGRFGAEDARLAAELERSAKDRAENLMIVDLVRNDLGRVAVPGSVELERPFAIERYPTVWQMTSTVAARSRARLPELFAALFPCASVTGAPKPATMRLIRELEPAPRGVYCGAVGRVEPGGRARFAVAIRTLELDLERSRFRYGVGSGVTWDSDAAAEWRECLDKARVLDGAGPELELLETMRWRPGRGVELLELHLERLLGSAAYFGFAADEAALRTAVAARGAGLEGDHRLRLRLGRDGSIALDAEPFVPTTHAWRVALAPELVDSGDARLFHKTTDRGRYERARASAPEADEALLVNERGELTEGTRTNLFVQFGSEWVTPPLDSGLLPGVFRASLLAAGRVVEAPLYPRDLRRAHRVRLGNALRGWIAVDAGSAGRLGRR